MDLSPQAFTATAAVPNAALARTLTAVQKRLDRDLEHQMYREALRTSAAYACANLATALPIRDGGNGEPSRFRLLEFALAQSGVANGAYAEFGVFQGESLGYLANRIDDIIYGFDSFQGLPEDWFLNARKGLFGLDGVSPHVVCSQQNFRLVRGLFSDTIPQFLSAVDKPMRFVHIDCCLYSSTMSVLEGLAQRIVPGTVMVFDEYFNYPGWEQHEHRALRAFAQLHAWPYDYLAFTPDYHSVAIRFR